MSYEDIFSNPPKEIGRLREGLLAWFGANGRSLPWRVNYLPYQVWVSEIMLQQTRVETMLPYYHRWMARFPDAASIAKAPEDEVLRLWEGLGYYARANNIRQSAQILVREYGGEVPCDFELLRRLPGIGPYTAGAIMSFAFDADYPAADANAGRIFARLFDIATPSGSTEFARAVRGFSSKLLPPGRSRDFNQALMDLGSMVCSARAPSCVQCPVSFCCAAFRKGLTGVRPVRAPKAIPTHIVRAAVVMVLEGRVLIRKRPETGLMPHLWELPGGEVAEGDSPEQAIGRIGGDELCLRLGPLESLGVILHAHTSFRVELHAFLCNGCDPSPHSVETGPQLRWVSIDELEKFAFPSAHRRIIGAFLERVKEQ
ncbi:MAG: A/G-specific adenine glycosylase [Syntrophobacteraceae bacterium]|nr:A/G-specific adenine glycosylase [Syntrophobacteraceae bacterium]